MPTAGFTDNPWANLVSTSPYPVASLPPLHGTKTAHQVLPTVCSWWWGVTSGPLLQKSEAPLNHCFLLRTQALSFILKASTGPKGSWDPIQHPLRTFSSFCQDQGQPFHGHCLCCTTTPWKWVLGWSFQLFPFTREHQAQDLHVIVWMIK